jgi:hypothetical protein
MHERGCAMCGHRGQHGGDMIKTYLKSLQLATLKSTLYIYKAEVK